MAHSTGSNLGDPLEVQALTSVFSKYTKQKQFCMISSIKPLIGHTFAASGTVALISMLMAMKNQIIPATHHCESENPYIPFKESPFVLCKENRSWIKKIRSRGWERSARLESAAPMHMQSLKNTFRMISRPHSGIKGHRRSL